MFPDGRPGAALLRLRLVAGILLIQDGVLALLGRPELQTIALQSAAIAAGTLLILGLWTPVAGALVILVEVCGMFSGTAHVRSSHSVGSFRGSAGCSRTWGSIDRCATLWKKAL
jgi:hypothetical protein